MTTADRTLTRDPDGPRGADADHAHPALCLVAVANQPLSRPVWLSFEDLDELVIGRGDAGLVADDARRRHAVWQLADDRVSRVHAKLSRIGAQLLVDDLGSKNGTFVDGTAAQKLRLPDGAVVEIGGSFFVHRVAPTRVRQLPFDLAAPGLPVISSAAVPFADTLAALARVAPTEVPVLLLGETGTGKEVLAKRLHALSGRRGALVAVNCGALPAELVEAELFGARKGAYSGAQADRPGLVRAAEGGTLFLDEIGDLPLPSQAALLRVLQEREVLPIGETRPIPVRFRLLSATHRDLDAAVVAGRMRADLYARLTGVTMRLTPLRERREDLGLLLAALLAPTRARLSAAALRALLLEPWRGNVRALEHAVQGAIARAGGGEALLDLPHFPDLSRELGRHAEPAHEPTQEDPPPDGLEAELVALLRTHNGNVSAVARVLGKKRMQVYRWLERFGIEPTRYR